MILVECEESQTVCIELRKLGKEAYSSDILPCSGGHPEWHIQGDAFDVVKGGRLQLQDGEYITVDKWGMIIMHPPCTKIALCGNSTYGKGMPKHSERLESIEWTKNLWNLAISVCDKVLKENPKNVMGSVIGKKTQTIQPYQFGHLEQKETWLWLHGLPLLYETNNVYNEMMLLPKRERERIHYMSPSDNRGQLRSKTFTGIAHAIATQYGNL